MQIKPGAIQSLPIFDQNDLGFFLGDEDFTVFLPKRDFKGTAEENETIEVFTFYNEEKELEATTALPQIQVGEAACFKIKTVNQLGAFVDIGSKRDILIPSRELREDVELGDNILIALGSDDANKRLFGTTKLNSFFNNKDAVYERGDEVEMLIAEKMELGRRVLINGKHMGILFRQEIIARIKTGEKVKGYVRKIEGRDIVVSMQREGRELLDDSKAKILNFLEMNGGYVRINDETDPEEIKLRLHMSKKSFKKACGMLFKEGKIILTKFGIKFNKTGAMPGDEDKVLRKWEENDEDKPASAPARPRKLPQMGSDRSAPYIAGRNEMGTAYEKPITPYEKSSSYQKPPPYEKPAFRTRTDAEDKKGSFSRSRIEKQAEKDEKKMKEKLPKSQGFIKNSKESKFNTKKSSGKKK